MKAVMGRAVLVLLAVGVYGGGAIMEDTCSGEASCYPDIPNATITDWTYICNEGFGRNSSGDCEACCDTVLLPENSFFVSAAPDCNWACDEGYLRTRAGGRHDADATWSCEPDVPYEIIELYTCSEETVIDSVEDCLAAAQYLGLHDQGTNGRIGDGGERETCGTDDRPRGCFFNRSPGNGLLPGWTAGGAEFGENNGGWWQSYNHYNAETGLRRPNNMPPRKGSDLYFNNPSCGGNGLNGSNRSGNYQHYDAICRTNPYRRITHQFMYQPGTRNPIPAHPCMPESEGGQGFSIRCCNDSDEPCPIGVGSCGGNDGCVNGLTGGMRCQNQGKPSYQDVPASEINWYNGIHISWSSTPPYHSTRPDDVATNRILDPPIPVTWCEGRAAGPDERGEWCSSGVKYAIQILGDGATIRLNTNFAQHQPAVPDASEWGYDEPIEEMNNNFKVCMVTGSDGSDWGNNQRARDQVELFKAGGYNALKPFYATTDERAMQPGGKIFAWTHFGAFDGRGGYQEGNPGFGRESTVPVSEVTWQSPLGAGTEPDLSTTTDWSDSPVEVRYNGGFRRAKGVIVTADSVEIVLVFGMKEGWRNLRMKEAVILEWIENETEGQQWLEDSGLTLTGDIAPSSEVQVCGGGSTNVGIDCEVSAWGACSATCGAGVRARTVTQPAISGGAACPPLMEECDDGPCPPIDAQVGAWGACSVDCGGGIRERTVTQAAQNGGGTPPLVEECNEEDCPAVHAQVGAWGECSEPCGNGVRERTVTQAAQNGGETPPLMEECNEEDCPAVDAQVGDWGACSATCGPGVRERTVTQAALNGGDTPSLMEECDDGDCPAIDAQVSMWGPCSTTCGDGLRTRMVTVPAQNGGATPQLVEVCPLVAPCPATSCSTEWSLPQCGPWSYEGRVKLTMGNAEQGDTAFAGSASRALDGNRWTTYTSGSCSHTTDLGRWWSADVPQTVTGFRITNRRDCCAHRLNLASIYLLTQSEWDDWTPGISVPGVTPCYIAPPRSMNGVTTMTFPCQKNDASKVIIIARNNQPLTLCEVEAHGGFEADGADGAPQAAGMNADGGASEATCQATIEEDFAGVSSCEPDEEGDAMTIPSAGAGDGTPFRVVASTANPKAACTIGLLVGALVLPLLL